MSYFSVSQATGGATKEAVSSFRLGKEAQYCHGETIKASKFGSRFSEGNKALGDSRNSRTPVLVHNVLERKSPYSQVSGRCGMNVGRGRGRAFVAYNYSILSEAVRPA